MSKISLNFFGEKVVVTTPKDLVSLRKQICQSFLFTPEDAEEVIITYKDNNGDKIIIQNNEDLKAFLVTKITTIDLDISQKSQIYQENLNKLKEESSQNQKKLDELLKKNEEYKKLLETKYKSEKKKIKEIDAKILKLQEQKKAIKKTVHEGEKKIEKEKNETVTKIIDLQKKMGVPVTVKVSPEKKHHHGHHMFHKEHCGEKFCPPFPPFMIGPFRHFFRMKHCNPFEAKVNISSDNALKKEEKKLEIHHCVMCDGCKMRPLIGNRYKCKTCPNFDFCEACYEKMKVSHGHEFTKIEKSQFPFFGPRGWHHFPFGRHFGHHHHFGKQLVKPPTHLNHCPTMENVLPQKPVHSTVTCDGCGVFPIVGTRYKCAYCDNFDYCEECEKKLSATHGHPFLKIYDPKMKPVFFQCTPRVSTSSQ